MNRKYQSEQLMVIHESAQTLYKIGVIDGSKMKEFDEACLVEEPEERSLAKRSRRRGVYVKPY
ncbi:MAG: hypothetical protein LBL45_02445 [Treponema sp.]|nr:hypothetical protein [Treponema sp.]